MAVSHQWYIQWSPPSMVFADIGKQYEEVNPRFTEPQRWPAVRSHENNKFYYPTPYVRPVYENNYDEYDTDENTNYNGHTKAAALTFWMAMVGLVQPQFFPIDIDTPPFSTLHKWKQIDFLFPSQRLRTDAIKTGKFIPENVLPLGLEVWRSRVFVTLPSWRRGVPATLATVSKHGGWAPSPPLEPYPNWSYHRAFSVGGNCTGLTSVFRINADPCGRLWVLDSGQIDSQDSPKQVCPPSLVVFDLETDQLLARFKIPSKYVLQDSLFANIIVDTRQQDCSDLHVYIADTWRFGLIVFRENDEKFWRFSHHLFYPDPLASNYTLHGINFQWADGIFGLALSPIKNSQERILYFHSMSSYREFYVSTEVLQNPLRVNNSATEFNLVGESRGLFGQSSASYIDRRGVMFYGLVSQDSVGCWDTRKPYKKATMGIVAMNLETLVFPNDIKVDQEFQQNVWVISNKLPMFQAGSLNPEDYNYRIMHADVREAVRGTVCDPAPHRKLLKPFTYYSYGGKLRGVGLGRREIVMVHKNDPLSLKL